MRRESWLPAAPESAQVARAIVRDATAELGLDHATTWDLMLATTEAIANAVEHGAPCGSRGILLRLERREDTLGVVVRDCGGCFHGESSKPEGDGGRGIRLIAAVMDHVEVTPAPDATQVHFAKRLAA